MSRSVSPVVPAPGRLEFARNAPLDVLVWRASGSTREWVQVHPGLTVVLFDDSSADLWHRGAVSRCQSGDVGVFEPGRVTRCWNQTARGDFRFIELPADIFERVGIAPRPQFPRPMTCDRALRELAEALFDAVEQQLDLSVARQRLEGFCRALAQSGAAQLPPPDDMDSPMLERVRAHVESNLNRALPIEELATVAGMSRFAFVRAWKREVGLPPHAYVVHRRVMSARRRLCDEVAIAAVADECGFHDQSHLHRHFKRITGVTPGVFQRSLRADAEPPPPPPAPTV